MAIEFGPVFSQPTTSTKEAPRMTRLATPEAFAVALRTIDVPTPQAMSVLFTPAAPRPGAHLDRKIEWVTDQNAFTIGPKKQAEIVNEAELKRLMDSQRTSSISVNLNGISKRSKIDEGVEIFTNQFLPTLTGGDFHPASSLIVGPVGPTGFTLSYNNPDMTLYLPYEEDSSSRDALTGWFQQLPSQQ